jgi:hypothetical protein
LPPSSGRQRVVGRRGAHALEGDVQDLNRRGGLVQIARLDRLYLRDFLNQVVAFHHPPEDRVPAVAVWIRRHGDEELAGARVRRFEIGHRQIARLIELERGHKLVPDGEADVARAVALRIAGLNHEALDDAVKRGPVV